MSKTYGIEYPMRDGMYVLPVVADSPEDALEHLRQAANHGRCFTPHGMTMYPAALGWWVKMSVWLQNGLRRMPWPMR